MNYRNLNKYLVHKNSMKKIGVVLFFAFSFLFLSGFVFAANCTSFNYSNWSSCSSGSQTRTFTSSTPSGCTGGSPVLIQNCTSNTGTTSDTNKTNIERGFACLANKVKSDCSGAKNIEEMAFTILASPDGITDDCVSKLETLKKDNCFGTGSSCDIKETAIAIVALNHVAKDTAKYVDWLKNQTVISSELIWYMQQNSEGATNCEITYDAQEYSFSADENKKLSNSAGSCLDLTRSNYWFMISPSCYEKKFSINCDKDFVATLSYKQPESQTIYILSDTKSSTANNPIELQVKSVCFGKNSCDYEASLWATLALRKSGADTQSYLPYLISSSDSNSQYLPSAFLHMIVDFGEFGSKLVTEQQFNYWEAENSAHNKYYDTALAILALDVSKQEQVIKARDWLKNTAQESDGCWNSGSITETAFALWSLERKTPVITTPEIPITYCTTSRFFCIASAACPNEERLSNYYCSTGSCCKNENLQSCSELKGSVCSDGEQCSGLEQKTSDSDSCCTGVCEKVETSSECESGGGSCRASCTSSQEEKSLDCDDSDFVCCKTVVKSEGKSLWWLWLLLILLIILVIIAILKREQIKVWIYKKKSGFKEGTNNSSGMPPVNPQNPMMRPPMQQRPGIRPLPTMIPQQRFPPQQNPQQRRPL